MKILTITCHNVYNHGASLQQFALLRHLESEGYDATTINYQPYYLAGNYSYLGVPSKRFKKNIFLRVLYILAKFPQRFRDRRRRKAFNQFHYQYIKETTRKYKNNKELKKELPVGDVYICGSDQIWNTLFENGKDPAFYLDFVPDNKTKLSYAASFSTDSVSPDLNLFLNKAISRLNAISVRERSGLDILSNLGFENTHQVVDPVFLLSEDTWKENFITDNHYSPYILVYDFDNNPLIKEYALYIKEKKGFQIFSLNKRLVYADLVFWDIGPEEFLNLIYHSSFVLANSFHATAFSCIFRKQFLTFNREASINTRMRDLLQDLDLTNRIVSDFDQNLIEQEIKFEKVNNAISNKVINSKRFLTKSINNEKVVY